MPAGIPPLAAMGSSARRANIFPPQHSGEERPVHREYHLEQTQTTVFTHDNTVPEIQHLGNHIHISSIKDTRRIPSCHLRNTEYDRRME